MYRSFLDELVHMHYLELMALLPVRLILSGLCVKEKLLPAGTYYLEYEIEDMFLRPTVLERIEMHWDGISLTFPEAAVPGK